MSNNKQSSVEWLVGEVGNHVNMSRKHFDELIEQAKEMHKEEIINAVHLCGYFGGATDEEATEYYILTYGGNK